MLTLDEGYYFEKFLDELQELIEDHYSQLVLPDDFKQALWKLANRFFWDWQVLDTAHAPLFYDEVKYLADDHNLCLPSQFIIRLWGLVYKFFWTWAENRREGFYE